MKNAYQIFSEYLFQKADIRGIPLSGTFELTSRCNLDCKMCYIHKRSNDKGVLLKERSAQDWIDLAKECAEQGTLHLLLTGGEPLLRSDFKEIYLGCRQLGMMISINTNATLIDRDMVAFFKSNPPARVNISLYGMSAETYGALCGDFGAYERVREAILALKEAGILVKINFSVTPYNKQDAQKVYSFAEEHGLALQAATYMYPPVRACELGCVQTRRLTPEESIEAQFVYDEFRFSKEDLKKRLQRQLSGVAVSEPDRECQELPTERIRCRAGKSTFWVTWDGKVRPCGLMTAPSVQLLPGKFRETWELIRAQRENILIPAKCTECELQHVCDQCAAVCHAETGSFTAVPKYMCERTKAYLKMAESVLKDL